MSGSPPRKLLGFRLPGARAGLPLSDSISLSGAHSSVFYAHTTRTRFTLRDLLSCSDWHDEAHFTTPLEEPDSLYPYPADQFYPTELSIHRLPVPV